VGCPNSCSSAQVKVFVSNIGLCFYLQSTTKSHVHEVLIIQASWNRGRFVIEYVGEMLTQDQAQKYGQIYDEIKRRSVDYSPWSILSAFTCYWSILPPAHSMFWELNKFIESVTCMIWTIRNQKGRQTSRWMDSMHPMLLVLSTTGNEIHYMDVHQRFLVHVRVIVINLTVGCDS